MLFMIFILPLCLADVWVSVDVKKIEKKLCEVDNPAWSGDSSGCSKLSHMTLEERMLPNHERRSTSYEHIDGVSRSTVSFWPTGSLENWMVAINFLAVDPVYGIARTCDRSGYVRIFQNVTAFTDSDIDSPTEKVVKIEGQCFTASVLVRASRGVCPWCTDNIKVQNEAPQRAAPPIDQKQLLLLVVLVLTVVTAISLTGSAVILCFFMCSNRTQPIYDCSTHAGSTVSRPHSDKTWMTASSASNCKSSTWHEERWAGLPDTPGKFNNSRMTDLYPDDIYEDYANFVRSKKRYDTISQSTGDDSGVHA